MLPADPTAADLDIGYRTRGHQIMICDAKRELAVQTHNEEHRLEDQWAAERKHRNRPWWKLWERNPT